MLVQFSQVLTSRRYLRDEEQPFKRHIQPQLDPNSQEVPLASLRSLDLGTRALVIVLESEALLIDGHQVVFERSFENNNEIQMMTQLSDDIEHCLYLQDPLNHFGNKRKATYIALVFCQILELLHV